TGDPAGGAASGVEGGVRIGMGGARFAWALLPLLALAVAPWTTRGGRIPRTAIVILAAIVIPHPPHVPTALAILAAAALVSPAPRRALITGGGAALGALGLTAVLGVPLGR